MAARRLSIKKCKKNAWSQLLIPPAILGSCPRRAGGRLSKKTGLRVDSPAKIFRLIQTALRSMFYFVSRRLPYLECSPKMLKIVFFYIKCNNCQVRGLQKARKRKLTISWREAPKDHWGAEAGKAST
jgi:hypothetical protein